MLKRIFLFVAISSFFMAACTKENTAPPIDLMSGFYPLKVGSVLVYEADSTAYSNFNNTIQNFKFEIKDSVTNTFTDLGGTINYRIERFKKLNPNSPWVFQLVFTRSKTVRSAEEFINNQRFTCLVFPPIKGSKWNGNSKNTIGEQDYMITENIRALTILSLNFDSTVTIKEKDEINLIREDFANVTYAKNVGLIQKEVKALDKNITKGKITNGFSFTLKIKSFK